MARTLFVLQGGGPTPVINATLAGIAESATGHFDQLLGLRHSFERCAENTLCNLSLLLQGESAANNLDLLAATPGALLGSSRKKVGEEELHQTLTTLRAANATDLIGIGGNGTMSVLATLAEFARSSNYPLNIIGAPKTVDNDLIGVHAAPGYGSAARYVALSVRDYDCDFRAMSTFDNVTILETMGRDSGWLAAASCVLKQNEEDAPHLVLLPEQSFDQTRFLDSVSRCHANYGRVFIVSNEMLRHGDGSIVGEEVQNGPRDALGRAMYSLSAGTGNFLSNLIWTQLGLQARCLRPGNLSRAVSFCQSLPDRDLARAAGREAVAQLMAGDKHEHMIGINENLEFSTLCLKNAVGEKPLARNFIDNETPFQIAESFRQFALPLIGEIPQLFDYKQLE